MPKVKEIFYTIQGEGRQAGRPAVFCRFSGCNLWSGIESDRQNAICKFCDTDFRGGFKLDDDALSEEISKNWAGGDSNKFVVFTGGEPLLQLSEALVSKVRSKGFEVAVETNGTVPISFPIDWICVSPKSGTRLSVKSGNELKLVYPQDGISPKDFETLDFEFFYLQPMDGPIAGENTRKSIDFCMNNPKWRLSLQTHKMIGVR